MDGLFNSQLPQLTSLFSKTKQFWVLCCAMTATFIAPNAIAQNQDPWWFEVEVIVFKRNIDPASITETFPNYISAISLNGMTDLFTPYLYPYVDNLRNALPVCHQEPEGLISLPLQTAPGFQIDESLFQPVIPLTLEEINAEQGAQETLEFENTFQSDLQDDQLTSENTTSDFSIRGPQTRVDTPPEIESFENAFSMPEDANEDLPTESTESTELTEETEIANQPILFEEQIQSEEITDETFERDSFVDFQEVESSETESIATLDTDDLFSDGGYFTPPAPEIPTFYPPTVLPSKQEQYGLVNWHLPQNIACVFHEEKAFTSEEEAKKRQIRPYVSEVPKHIDGIEDITTTKPYWLPKNMLRLNKLQRDINRKRDLTTIFHSAWRQPVDFGRNVAPFFRFSAGKNYSKEFTYEGYPIRETKLSDSLATRTDDSAGLDIVDRIELSLSELEQLAIVGPSNETSSLPLLILPPVEDDKRPEDVWQLDGAFKVFIELIGNVPYLHIDSNLNYRAPIPLSQHQLPKEYSQDATDNAELPNVIEAVESLEGSPHYLKSFNFQQLRRVISTQMHYFDHPLFGMVVQIRRHRNQIIFEDNE